VTVAGREPDGASAIAWHDLATSPAREAAGQVEAGGPPFLRALTASHRELLDRRWATTQWLGEVGGDPIVMVRAVTLRWDGTFEDVPAGDLGTLLGAAAPVPDVDTLAVVDVTVHPAHRGSGVGREVLAHLDDLRQRAGMHRLLLLVRPHAKQRHPLVPFARYLAAADQRGVPRDGWLAAVWEAGFHPARGVDRSLLARAPIAAWERWYGASFPTSGPYLVEGAIKPAIVELELDEGRYREPHLWVAPRPHLEDPVDPDRLRAPEDAWRRSLARAGVVAGSRRHREVRRPR
jgi:GNAT superfamily N-acetyltransferase